MLREEIEWERGETERQENREEQGDNFFRGDMKGDRTNMRR